MRRSNMKTSLINVSILFVVLYVANQSARADFVFGEPENLGPAVNSVYSDGIADLSSDGLELYFESDRPGSQGDSDIWVARRRTVDNPWEPAVKVDAPVNGAYSDYGPCIARDALALYFSSDRPGGSGGADIYVARRATVDDPWGEPVNLGSRVNGSFWDHCPSISADGLTLVFGSNREKIGTDYSTFCYIYVSTRPTMDAPWGTPVRLGAAVNPGLAYDSDYPCISADGLSLYFRRVYGDSKSLWVATRTSLSDSWTRAIDLGMRGASPRFSVDGSVMTWTSRGYGGYGDADLLQVNVQPIVDFNGDEAVDCLDICDMIDHWGTDDSLYDIGPTPFGDGVVDAKDLVVLAEHMTTDADDYDDVK